MNPEGGAGAADCPDERVTLQGGEIGLITLELTLSSVDRVEAGISDERPTRSHAD